MEVVMLYRSLFPRSFWVDFDHIQRELQSACDASPAQRAHGRGDFAAMKVGRTADAVEVAFNAPGMDPKGFEVDVDNGVLTVSGERAAQPMDGDDKSTLRLSERFAGRFSRAVKLPDDVDTSQVTADYRNGVLLVRLARRPMPESRRITVQ
jgi:HSP20 family protein